MNTFHIVDNMLASRSQIIQKSDNEAQWLCQHKYTTCRNKVGNALFLCITYHHTVFMFLSNSSVRKDHTFLRSQ